MTIWGHSSVHVTKNPENREWVVSTPNPPHQHLVTIPWTDAFKVFKHAPDYSAAIASCQSHPDTALTRAEERAARREIETPTSTPTQTQTPTEPVPVSNVVSLKDFKRRRK